MFRKKTVLLLALLIAVTGSAAALISNRGAETAAHIDALTPTGAGPLDGMTFTGMLGPEGRPKDIADTFVFAGGTFVSKECELRCDYPARPYAAVETDDGWRFESVTRCPYKDATIVWRGTVRDGRVEGVATWTMRRWYWSLERDFTFEARQESPARVIAEDG